MLDNYAGVLAPKYHSDGTYSQTNVSQIKKALPEYPDKPVFLCSHFFDPAKESEELFRLIQENTAVIGGKTVHIEEHIQDETRITLK